MCLILCAKAIAIAPESFSNWSLGLGSKAPLNFEVNYTNNHSEWSSAYQHTELVTSFNNKNHAYSFGAKTSSNNENTQRDAWFIRYDYLIKNKSSLSLKYIQQNWYFIESGRESIGMAYNSDSELGYFYNFGYYTIWLKQSWNNSQYTPFSFSTNDIESFFIFLLGWRFDIDNSRYWTLDINNRDYFSYYSPDNWAIDFKFYIASSRSVAMTLTAGIRFSGLTALTPYPASYYSGLGFIF